MTERAETAVFSIPYREGSVASREVAAIRNGGDDGADEIVSVASREVAAIRNSDWLRCCFT